MKKHSVDARGLSCPQPVVLTRRALENNANIVVLVDNEAARENIKQMAGNIGCRVEVEENAEGTFSLHINKASDAKTTIAKEGDDDSFVVVISDERMGRGDDVLGNLLIRGFIYTLTTIGQLPRTVIFYNAGVKLALQDSPSLDDLKVLEAGGTEVLVCGTCLNFFGVAKQLAVGSVSNMYDIVEKMASAKRLLIP